MRKYKEQGLKLNCNDGNRTKMPLLVAVQIHMVSVFNDDGLIIFQIQNLTGNKGKFILKKNVVFLVSYKSRTNMLVPTILDAGPGCIIEIIWNFFY